MIFCHNYLISEPVFKLFVALFMTHELQKDDMVIFFLWSFRKVRFRKMQFLKDGVQTVADTSMSVPVIYPRPLWDRGVVELLFFLFIFNFLKPC